MEDKGIIHHGDSIWVNYQFNRRSPCNSTNQAHQANKSTASQHALVNYKYNIHYKLIIKTILRTIHLCLKSLSHLASFKLNHNYVLSFKLYYFSTKMPYFGIAVTKIRITFYYHKQPRQIIYYWIHTDCKACIDVQHWTSRLLQQVIVTRWIIEFHS